jgi:hypothetical protein
VVVSLVCVVYSFTVFCSHIKTTITNKWKKQIGQTIHVKVEAKKIRASTRAAKKMNIDWLDRWLRISKKK